MKTSIMMRTLLLGIVCLFGLNSCKEDASIKTAKFLDVNIRFNGAFKPQAGNVLLLNLYYKDMTGIPYDSGTPNDQLEIILTEEQISKGMRLTFENFTESAEIAQVAAFVDIDGDGTLSDGDLGGFYNNGTLDGVESGEQIPDNVISEYAITFNVNQLIGSPVGKAITDIDGNVYETVMIGEQEWMKENLRVTRYRNGDPIPTDLDNTTWSKATSGAYAIYPHANVNGISSEEEMVAVYGLLYNWFVADNQVGVCPEGWRVPTDNDWQELETTVGMSSEEANAADWRGAPAALALKAINGGWVDSENNGTDEFGFGAHPGGARQANGTYFRIGEFAYFWTSTPSATQPMNGLRRLLRYNYASINRSNVSKNEGSCIRCVRVR